MRKRRTVNVSMPPEMLRWVEKKAESGGYGTTSEYFRHLVRQDRSIARLRAEIEAEVEASMKERAEPWTPTDMERIAAEGRKRLRSPRRKSA